MLLSYTTKQSRDVEVHCIAHNNLFQSFLAYFADISVYLVDNWRYACNCMALVGFVQEEQAV